MVTYLRRRPTLIEGSVIPSSSRKVMMRGVLGAVGLCFVLLLAVGLLASRAQAREVNSTAVQLIVVVVVWLLFAPIGFVALWRSRVVIGGDRLQVVRGRARVARLNVGLDTRKSLSRICCAWEWSVCPSAL